MKSAALTYGSGPGSAIALSPTSVRVRDAIIEKFIDKSLDELNGFLASALDTETDEHKRIGILAARVFILRHRINKISEYNANPLMTKVEEVRPHELVSIDEEEETILTDMAGDAEEAMLEDWNELVTIEDGEVNGVRIPSGVTITVGREDAARLIETGKAVRVAEDGSVLEDAPAADTLQNDVTETGEDAENAEAAVQDNPDDSEDVLVQDSGAPANDIPADDIPADTGAEDMLNAQTTETSQTAAETAADDNSTAEAQTDAVPEEVGGEDEPDETQR